MRSGGWVGGRCGRGDLICCIWLRNSGCGRSAEARWPACTSLHGAMSRITKTKSEQQKKKADEILMQFFFFSSPLSQLVPPSPPFPQPPFLPPPLLLPRCCLESNRVCLLKFLQSSLRPSGGAEGDETEVVGHLELFNNPLQQCGMIEKCFQWRTGGGAPPSRPRYSLWYLIYFVISSLPGPTFK